MVYTGRPWGATIRSGISSEPEGALLRIAVVGTGHVGLISCVTFAHIGHEVVGIDADGAKIETLKAGRSPFFEPGVQELLDEGIANGRLRFTSD